MAVDWGGSWGNAVLSSEEAAGISGASERFPRKIRVGIVTILERILRDTAHPSTPRAQATTMPSGVWYQIPARLSICSSIQSASLLKTRRNLPQRHEDTKELRERNV